VLEGKDTAERHVCRLIVATTIGKCHAIRNTNRAGLQQIHNYNFQLQSVTQLCVFAVFLLFHRHYCVAGYKKTFLAIWREKFWLIWESRSWEMSLQYWNKLKLFRNRWYWFVVPKLFCSTTQFHESVSGKVKLALVCEFWTVFQRLMSAVPASFLRSLMCLWLWFRKFCVAECQKI